MPALDSTHLSKTLSKHNNLKPFNFTSLGEIALE